ncbi:MAG: hypothetical protein M1823_001646 [Watsoniomyces obsoletus]|nr:MAG: hypothetical protein M1823_001646 [Watsoniomyces obsoletus]
MASETIRKLHGYAPDRYVYYPVVAVGAGVSGIAMGCQLKTQLNFDQFRIFDRNSGIGGTWWINRYPGVACDIPATFYSFSFSPNYKWTTFHPSGLEIVKYLEDICAKYQIVDKINLNTDISEARWLEDEEQWEITLIYMRPGLGEFSQADREKYIQEHGRDSVYIGSEKIRAKVLVSAVGGLVEPRAWPKNIPGRETFKGEIFHSGRWKADVDFQDKNVVVVGTGSSSVQIVPKLTQAPYHAKSVTQIMRSPPWVLPRLVPPGGDEGWGKWSPTLFSTFPVLAMMMRLGIFLLGESDWFRLFGSSEFCARERKKTEAKLLEHMKRVVPKKYHEILTPNYGVGCKRRVLDAFWFESFNDERIELTTQPLTSIRPHSVILGPGRMYPESEKPIPPSSGEREIPADVIVLANGFDVGEWLHPMHVVGRGGKALHDVWRERGGAQAYLGTVMDGFPNMFMIFGPNTATGHSSIILASENMVNLSLKFIGPLLRGEMARVEVKREAEMAWTKEVQEQLKKTVFNAGCRNWYQTENGWNSATYPYSQFHFAYRCMFVKWKDWDIKYTRKGNIKNWVRQMIRAVLLVLAIVGGFQARRHGYGLLDAPRLIQHVFWKTAMPGLTRGLERAHNRLYGA